MAVEAGGALTAGETVGAADCWTGTGADVGAGASLRGATSSSSSARLLPNLTPLKPKSVAERPRSRDLDARQRVTVARRHNVNPVAVDLQRNRIAGMGGRAGHQQRGEEIELFHRSLLEWPNSSAPWVRPALFSVMCVTRRRKATAACDAARLTGTCRQSGRRAATRLSNL
jgi:hypothetical protein